MRRIAVLSLMMIGCNADLDEPWDLEHDRIIAVRAEPPGIQPGETSRIDMLLGYDAMPVEVKRPDVTTVISPMSLADIVRFDGDNWLVTAPSAERIAAARTELGIEGEGPVPVRLGVAVAWPTPVKAPEGNNGFAATKVVWLGAEYVNPPILGLTIDGVEPAADQTEVVFAKVKGTEPPPKTRLFVEADDQRDIVNWLTSCGTMHDFDLSSSAYVTVDDEDRVEGQFALVVRDELGGVSWRIWNCRAE